MSYEVNDRKHSAVLVEVGSWSAEIDERIAPLIREIWIAGIETMMSCQEDGWGKVWINFPDLANLVCFLNAVAEYEPGRNSLYNRMSPAWRADDPEVEWIYDMHPDDLGLMDDEPSAVDGEAPSYVGPPDFFFTFSVRFPPSDLPTVLARMQRFNSSENQLSSANSSSAANL